MQKTFENDGIICYKKNTRVSSKNTRVSLQKYPGLSKKKPGCSGKASYVY